MIDCFLNYGAQQGKKRMSLAFFFFSSGENTILFHPCLMVAFSVFFTLKGGLAALNKCQSGEKNKWMNYKGGWKHSEISFYKPLHCDRQRNGRTSKSIRD